jgi:hypothetical protein
MALGDGSSWDETTPTDATIAIQIDDYNRDLRLGVRSRMALEHEFPASQAATSEAGRHKFVSFQVQATSPLLPTGTQIGCLFVKTVGTTGQSLIYMNNATQEVNISRKNYFWYIDGTAEPSVNASSTLYIISDGKILASRAYASTAPGGSELQVDVLYNGSSIWTATSSQLILAAGSTSTAVTGFVTTAVTAGGVFTIDIDKTGSSLPGGNVTVMLEVG